MLPWEERGLAAGLAAEKSSGAHGRRLIRAGLRPGRRWPSVLPRTEGLGTGWPWGAGHAA